MLEGPALSADAEGVLRKVTTRSALLADGV